MKVTSSEIYNYLISKGVSHTHAIGMIANIKAESAFNSAAEGDNGASYGLFQHNLSRRDALVKYINDNYENKDWKTNWKGQIDYALTESDTNKYLNTPFKNTNDASKWFTINWERPANAVDSAEKRIDSIPEIEQSVIDTTTSPNETVVIEEKKEDVDKTKLKEFYDNLGRYKEMKTSSYELTEEEIKSLKSDIYDYTYSFYKEGVKGSDRKGANNWIIGLSKKLGIDKLDKSNPKDMAKARAILNFSINHVKGEEYAENMTGEKGAIDSKLEDVFEDNSFNKINLFNQAAVPTENKISKELDQKLKDSEYSKYFKTVSDNLETVTWDFENKSFLTKMLADHDPETHKEFVTTGDISLDDSVDDIVNVEEEVTEEVVTEEDAEIPEVIETPEEDQPSNRLQNLGGLAGNILKGAAGVLDGIGGPGAIISYMMGKKGLKAAMKEVVPQKRPELSPMFMQHMRQVKELSKKGFHPAEEIKFRKEIDNAYQHSLEKKVRGTGGDRAKFLAQTGILDAARSSALLDYAAKDADLQRKNQDRYEKMMLFKENYDIQRTEQDRLEDLERQVANKEAAINFTSAAFTNAMSGLNKTSVSGLVEKFLGATSGGSINVHNPEK